MRSLSHLFAGDRLRESADDEALTTAYRGGVSVETALAKLPRPGGLLRALSVFVVRYRIVSRATASEAAGYRSAPATEQGTLAKPDVLAQASASGLRFVGTYAFRGFTGWIPREGWVSEDGAVRLSARRAHATGLEGTMSAYYLSTTFADGTALLTWAKSPPPIATTPTSESIGGTGDLAVDLATHRAALARRAPDAAPAIPAVTVDDCVALSMYYDRFLSSDESISNIVVPRLIMWGGIAAILAFLVGLLIRML